MIIEIPGRLPGLNEIIDAAKLSPYIYSKMKDRYTNIIAWTAKMMPKFEGKVDIKIKWIEPNGNRDPDNVAAGKKFILDGLVKSGIIKNDSSKYINSTYDIYEVDRKNPRIEIEINEVKGD